MKQLAFMACLLILCGFAGGCDNGPLVGSQITQAHKATAEATFGFEFPKRTNWLFYEHWQDEGNAIFVKVRVPRRDMAELLSHKPLSQGEWSTTERAIVDRDDADPWKPSSAERFRSNAFKLSGNQSLSVLIDDDSYTSNVIYLVWVQP